jgi:hypothetical protein
MREPAPDVVAQARGLLDQCPEVGCALPGEGLGRQVLEPFGLACQRFGAKVRRATADRVGDVAEQEQIVVTLGPLQIDGQGLDLGHQGAEHLAQKARAAERLELAQALLVERSFAIAAARQRRDTRRFAPAGRRIS